MPEKLLIFLRDLSKEEKELFWNWLDGDPEVVDKMIRVVNGDEKGIKIVEKI